MCSKTYGKVPTAWCDDLWSVWPWKDALGKREETKKGKYNNMVCRSYGRSLTWYWTDGMKGIGYRNVNSSSWLTSMICCLSNSGSWPEWYSELPCDDSLPDSYSIDCLESCSNGGCDMASIQGSGTLAGVSCSFVLRFNLVKVEIRELRPEVLAESDEVLVHYQSRTNVRWGLSTKTLA